ncbi:protein adenylyltransferase SelO [Reichenbachiella ulvae]|uniref:Protein nucleotidyltransferase YdiU n=1 Tax=Reichenbachiella ulvae TaxID=2980104 RepID=A0ABT3CQJ4_9BACT|nr:YdiU family protein [Reichenbachiella ulvae]MCV9385932.1 YdiU family protein [Reichenbachiella ulvae]
MLENSYHDQLPSSFYSEQAPVPVAAPEMFVYNHQLAADLDLPADWQDAKKAMAWLSGNMAVADSQPIAQAYAGHQFGHFTMLGDGRAILLGEIVKEDQRYDMQLKGSGRTLFSRKGDGRATLYSMLREYLISEAMHHLGIPTTRSLAVVKSGEKVQREYQHEGAILTRIAKSHLRVGTFEFARVYRSDEELKQLLDYSIQRHDPSLVGQEDVAMKFFQSVIDRQIDLVVHWMRVGFIHGVMNTDNTSIAGESIDYGPCAFMNAYHPDTVFSSIDRQGRYAYSNQPRIVHWNLAVLANALLPLLDQDEKKAIERVEAVLNEFPEMYRARYFSMMLNKLGIAQQKPDDAVLVQELMQLLAEHRIDYTNFFVSLRHDSITEKALLEDERFISWKQRWKEAHERDVPKGLQLMDENNPVVIPRNHLVEQALEEAVDGKMKPFNDLLEKLSQPYAQDQSLQEVPEGFDRLYQTYCGT